MGPPNTDEASFLTSIDELTQRINNNINVLEQLGVRFERNLQGVHNLDRINVARANEFRVLAINERNELRRLYAVVLVDLDNRDGIAKRANRFHPAKIAM
jgi:predicted aminopeptidase